MQELQNLVIEPRKKNSVLESQLSLAQDSIGAAERRSQLMETKNAQLQADVDF